MRAVLSLGGLLLALFWVTRMTGLQLIAAQITQAPEQVAAQRADDAASR